MLYFLLILIAFGEAAGACWLMWMRIGKKAAETRQNIKKLETELETKTELAAKLEKLFAGMVEVRKLRETAEEYKARRESLKAERGRITITQAELETVESRLRELEEIERELEASTVETREEINILTKKKDELNEKNETLRQQLSTSFEQMDAVFSEIEMNAQMQERIGEMRAELVRTQEQIDLLLQKVQEGNDQYFVMKQRYDALDIEYAQLYEKFSATEVGAEE